jgi:hypothetical protein
MGCLLELIFQILLEGFMELVLYGYLKLVTLFLPEHTVSAKLEQRIKATLMTVFLLLFAVMFIGVCLLLDETPAVATVGVYMTYIPLGIIGAQVVLGILVRIIRHFRK